MTSIGPSSLAYSFGKSREKLVLFVTIWAFQHSSRKTKHLCALMEPKQGFECGSWAKEVALDVFIKMNTSSVRLSTYDIVVALVEEETGKSLHEHVDALNVSVPRASEYADLPGLVLDVVALRQDRIPSRAGYRGIDYARMLNEWDTVVKGTKGMVSFLEDECVFDAQRLPSYTAIPILAALWEHLPTQPDKLGNARLLLRTYLCRAFLSCGFD